MVALLVMEPTPVLSTEMQGLNSTLASVFDRRTGSSCFPGLNPPPGKREPCRSSGLVGRMSTETYRHL